MFLWNFSGGIYNDGRRNILCASISRQQPFSKVCVQTCDHVFSGKIVLVVCEVMFWLFWTPEEGDWLVLFIIASVFGLSKGIITIQSQGGFKWEQGELLEVPVVIFNLALLHLAL